MAGKMSRLIGCPDTVALKWVLPPSQEHPEAFEQLQRSGMGRNSSWDQAASQYEQIFDWAMVRCLVASEYVARSCDSSA